MMTRPSRVCFKISFMRKPGVSLRQCRDFMISAFTTVSYTPFDFASLKINRGGVTPPTFPTQLDMFVKSGSGGVVE